ncbi:MAG TPA: hypothetical protein VGT80_00340, partial [Phenylobacterium sp.]|nr:hypothetical protein [Phenylobacterium sp.]
MSNLKTTLTGALTAALAISLVAAAPADARRGGSFGSRGYRTYSAPRPTSTAPGYTAPVQRSMTPGAPGGASPYGYQPAGPSYMPGAGGFAPRRAGFGTGLVTGLVTGGLIGGLMGHGFGGGWGYGGGMGMGGGFLTILLQLLIFGLIASFVMRLFRRRTPAMAGGFASPFDAGPAPQAGPWGGGFAGAGQSYSPADEIAVSSSDRAAFEQLLKDVQSA